MAEMIAGRPTPRESPAHPPDNPAQNTPAAKTSKLASIVRAVYSNDRLLQLVLLAFMLLWYSALLGVSWRLAMSDPLRLTFNSMLDHMLHGRFDVDPQVVKYEAFLRNGRVYSYFGIWCALLRLPLWLLRRMNVDVTFWSCLAAVCLAGLAKLRAVLLVRKHALNGPSANRAIGLMLAYIVLAGSAIAYLGVSIYQEVMLWAYAFAAVFVYFAVKGMVNRSLQLRTLNWMALCAGLALLTRVSVGVGLMLATVLLLLALTLELGARQQRSSAPIRRLVRALTHPRILAPLAILTVFVGAAGAINYFRWGNPATFANYDLYMERNFWPGFLLTLHTYGVFSLRRIPFGFVYYFFPVWVLHGSNGQLLFASTQTHLFGDIELPPGTFFLTDLLPLCFIVLLAIALWRRRAARLPRTGHWAMAVALGLLVPCILMLSLAWMIYRYRLEFYPEIDFLAFLGLLLTVTDEATLAKFARCRRWFTAAFAVSVFASMMALALFDLSGDEAPQELLRPGIVRYYSHQVAFHLRRTAARDFGSHQ